MTQVKPPNELGAAGRKLWRNVTVEATKEGLELDSREQNWLISAAKLADRVAEMEAALADAPLTVRGSQGQLVAHPLLAEVRQHVQLQGQLLARIKTDVPDAGAGVLGVVGGSRQRAAANKRWRGA